MAGGLRDPWNCRTREPELYLPIICHDYIDEFYWHDTYLDIHIIIFIAGGEVSVKFQYSASIFFPSACDKPILAAINTGEAACGGKTILQ